MNLQDVVEKLTQIKKKGFIATIRAGDTGIGMTLENALGIEENNISLPDLGVYEIKAKRKESSSPITLLTYDKGAWGKRAKNGKISDQHTNINKYGYKDKNGRQGFYITPSIVPNIHGLYLSLDDINIMVKHTDGTTIATWELSIIKSRMTKKVKNTIIVNAESSFINEKEHFRYETAKLCSQSILLSSSNDRIKNLIENGKILFDIRAHVEVNKKNKLVIRSRGTSFRINDNELENLYQKITDLKI